MSRHVVDGILDPLAARIAALSACDMSQEAIGHAVGVESAYVRAILLRPEVQRRVIQQRAAMGVEIAPALKDLSAAIEEKAHRAFEIEQQMMEDFVHIGDAAIEKGEPHVAIKAKLAAATTAQDILDRAGQRAPTRTVSAKVAAPVSPQAIEQVANVLQEMGAQDVEVTITESR